VAKSSATNEPDPPPNSEASYTQEDIDEILGEKKPIWTCGTERAIARHKLYPFLRKGFTALVGPQNNFRYLGEPALLGQIWGDADGVTGDFSAELPGSEGKTAIHTRL
jgi:hypothetical protein